MKVIREGQPLSIPVRSRTQVTLAAVETPKDQAQAKPDFFIGIYTKPVDETLRSHLNLPEGQGILVQDVISGSPPPKKRV